MILIRQNEPNLKGHNETKFKRYINGRNTHDKR